METPRKPYSGIYRKLVLAFDIGTTYSGISYSVLDPGQIPEIKGVTRYCDSQSLLLSQSWRNHIYRFPAQMAGGDLKIPSILYYDRQGNLKAIGAEAAQPSIADQAEDKGWVKVEWHVQICLLPVNNADHQMLGSSFIYCQRPRRHFIIKTVLATFLHCQIFQISPFATCWEIFYSIFINAPGPIWKKYLPSALLCGIRSKGVWNTSSLTQTTGEVFSRARCDMLPSLLSLFLTPTTDTIASVLSRKVRQACISASETV